jgi:hypothetical protein
VRPQAAPKSSVPSAAALIILAPIARKTHDTCALNRHPRPIAILPRPGGDLAHLSEAEAELPLDPLRGRQGARLRMRGRCADASASGRR